MPLAKSDRFFSLWLRAKGFAAGEQKKKGDPTKPGA
jgi:hypothetical protein